jgi:membrane-bound ClpP family serine protease
MHSLLKAAIGAIIAIVGFALMIIELPIVGALWKYVVTFLLGFIPLFLVFIGVLIAWLYIDEWKIEKELEKEELEEEKSKKKK